MIENVTFFQDDDTEEPVATRTLEEDLQQNTNGNDEVIIMVDIRRIQKKVRNERCCHAVHGRSRFPL